MKKLVKLRQVHVEEIKRIEEAEITYEEKYGFDKLNPVFGIEAEN